MRQIQQIRLVLDVYKKWNCTLRWTYLLLLNVLFFFAYNPHVRAVEYSNEERAYIQKHRGDTIPFFSVYSRRYEPDAVLIDNFVDILNRDSGLTFSASYEAWPIAFGHVSQHGLSVLTRITDLPSRQNTFYFTAPYFERPLFYLTTKDITCCDDNSFAGKQITSITDSYFTQELRSLGANVVGTPTIETLLYELISGKYEGGIADWSDIISLRKELSETFRQELVDRIAIHQISSNILSPSKLSIAVNKQDPLLFSIINKHFEANLPLLKDSAIQASERLKTMFFIADNEQERVFIENHPQPSICFPFDSPPLIKSTGNGNLGRSYISNLLSELEKQLGLTFDFQNVTFENYLTKMANNECQAFIMAEGFAQQLGLEYTSSSLLNTEIVLVSNLRDVYFTRPELIQDLKVGSVARLPLDAFNIPIENSIVAPLPELLQKLDKREIDALAMIREQAGYMMTTNPERDLSVIANAGLDYRFVLGAHPRNTTFIQILERGLKKISTGFINQEYRQAMTLVPTKETDKTPIIAMGVALLIVTLVAAILISLSRRKAAKNALIAQMQNDFLSNMSHELRTPLNGVFGIFQLLELEDLSPKCQQMIAVGLNSTRTLSLLINDILDYDKLHQGKVAHEPKPTHVIQKIQGIIDLHITQAREKSLFIHLEVQEDVPEWVTIDPVRLEQLCNNIIGNAVKFTETGGLTISVQYREEQLTLEFNDTGIGMSKELQNMLFERFTQGHDNKTNTFRGTGLGMAICKELVALMGGSISVQSTVGTGSNFTVVLPAKETAPVEKSTPHLGSLSGLKILCADDDKSIQKVMGGMLTKLGAECVMVANGVEAMSAARKAEFDLILMDINMPIMGGIEFLADYRRSGGTLPVIAFTANAMLEDVEHYESLGFSSVLTKPVALEHLYQTLKSFI